MSDSIEAHHSIEPIEAEWEELASRVGAPPFMWPGWIAAWWGAFGAGRLEVIALRRDGRLAGVLPIFRRRRVVRSPTNWHTPAYGPVAEDNAAALGLFNRVFEHAPRRVDLSFLFSDGSELESLERAAGSYQIVRRVIMRSPYVPVERAWDSYWTTLSKNLRGTVRRCRNRLEERGEVALEVADGTEVLEPLLEEAFRLESTGWKRTAGTAIISTPETLRFYRQVSRWAAERGLLKLAFLRVDGRGVAFNLSVETEQSHYLLKPGYDVELKALGPGTVLTAEMVKRAFYTGLETYEFLGAADPYKLRWSKTCRDLIRAQAFAPSLAGAVDSRIQTRGRQIAKRVLRRNPASPARGR